MHQAREVWTLQTVSMGFREPWHLQADATPGNSAHDLSQEMSELRDHIAELTRNMGSPEGDRDGNDNASPFGSDDVYMLRNQIAELVVARSLQRQEEELWRLQVAASPRIPPPTLFSAPPRCVCISPPYDGLRERVVVVVCVCLSVCLLCAHRSFRRCSTNRSTAPQMARSMHSRSATVQEAKAEA